jgi:hypothetical protein
MVGFRRAGESERSGEGVFGSSHLVVLKLKRDLTLPDFFDGDFQVIAACPFDQRAGAFHELLPPSLYQSGELEAATHHVDDLITLERLNHRKLQLVQ